MKETSNASTERILTLLILLLQGEYSKVEVLSRIAEYERDTSTTDSQRKMFERDLSTLEHVGIQVTHRMGKDGMFYSALLPPSRHSLLMHDDMPCLIWDRAILPRF